MESVDILIVGAGPTGLGAASRLAQHNTKLKTPLDFLLIDAAPEAGGLACTDTTPQGFLFDLGGHVIFSHFQFFDDLLTEACGSDSWNEHQRVSYVWMRNRWIAYPFQNNISALDVDDQIACLTGLVEAKCATATRTTKPANFDEWIECVMGAGINDIFMRPYNFKVWAYPTTEMQCSWLGERVATADVSKAISNVLTNTQQGGWGPNALFKFPKEGGTGGIWKKVAKKCVPAANQRYSTTMASIDADKKIVTMSDGKTIKYNKLLSTVPLDLTLNMLSPTPSASLDYKSLGARLRYSSSHIIGIGLRGVNPHDLKCWLYYPEDNCPFYRCTIFSHYADANVPAAGTELPTLQLGDGSPPASTAASPGPYWSLMLEVSESAAHKPVDIEKVVAETIQGCVNVQLITGTDEIVSLYHRRLEHGYPTPHVERDEVLAEVLPHLKSKDIWSRGRFGNYKYEVANQDHSCMLGVEAADNMVFGSREFTLNYCSLVNEGGQKYQDMRYEL